jgi:hypothetical protein
VGLHFIGSGKTPSLVFSEIYVVYFAAVGGIIFHAVKVGLLSICKWFDCFPQNVVRLGDAG